MAWNAHLPRRAGRRTRRQRGTIGPCRRSRASKAASSQPIRKRSQSWTSVSSPAACRESSDAADGWRFGRWHAHAGVPRGADLQVTGGGQASIFAGRANFSANAGGARSGGCESAVARSAGGSATNPAGQETCALPCARPYPRALGLRPHRYESGPKIIAGSEANRSRSPQSND